MQRKSWIYPPGMLNSLSAVIAQLRRSAHVGSGLGAVDKSPPLDPISSHKALTASRLAQLP